MSAIAWEAVPRPSIRSKLRLVALAVVAVAGALLALVGPDVGAQQRHVVVVSDSILLGAQAPCTSRLQGAGWTVDFDGAVSRSTSAGAEAVSSRSAGLTDSLVISLGANDAGNPATFRSRVDSVMAAAGAVPHVYWITIREVRPYYAPANQILRDAATRYPNLTVVDWHAASAGRDGLTSSDGLHLTPTGANALADLLAAAVTTGSAPAIPAAPAAPAAAAPVEAPPAPVEPAPAAVPSPAPVEAPTTTAAPTTVAPTSTVAEEPERVELAGDAVAATVEPSTGLGSAPWVLVVLAALVGAFALARRSPRMPFALRSASVPVGPAHVSRAQLRAARIAGAQERHPSTADVPPVPDEPGSPAPDGISTSVGGVPSGFSGTEPTADRS